MAYSGQHLVQHTAQGGLLEVHFLFSSGEKKCNLSYLICKVFTFFFFFASIINELRITIRIRLSSPTIIAKLCLKYHLEMKSVTFHRITYSKDSSEKKHRLSLLVSHFPLLITRVVVLFCGRTTSIASKACAKKLHVLLFILLLSCLIQPSIWRRPMQALCWRALPSPWNWASLAKGHKRTPLHCVKREQDLVRAIFIRAGLL